MIKYSNLKPEIGSEVTIDKQSLLDGSRAQDIRDLLVKRSVVVLRGIDFTEEEHRVFAGTLGRVRTATGAERVDKKNDNGGLLKIAYFPGNFFWHMDGTYEVVPPLATVLTPIVLSGEGGQTEFASTYAAFDALPQQEREYLETLRVLNTMQASMFNARPDATLSDFEAWLAFPQQVHPLVWRHETGRKSLFIGSASTCVVGMHVAESCALLDRLISHATSDRFVYRHEWRAGDVVVWDNTGAMHRVLPYPQDSGRRMHRFMIEREEASAAKM